MNVVLTQPVEIALRTLSEEDRQQVSAWFEHLKNWENDPFVRDNSHKLASGDSVYVLRTTTDFRIFFSLHPDQIEILDLAKKATIAMFGHRSEHGES